MMSSSEVFSRGKGSVVLTDNLSGNPEALVEWQTGRQLQELARKKAESVPRQRLMEEIRG